MSCKSCTTETQLPVNVQTTLIHWVVIKFTQHELSSHNALNRSTGWRNFDLRNLRVSNNHYKQTLAHLELLQLARFSALYSNIPRIEVLFLTLSICSIAHLMEGVPNWKLNSENQHTFNGISEKVSAWSCQPLKILL
jgi:hypothetical protein